VQRLFRWAVVLAVGIAAGALVPDRFAAAQTASEKLKFCEAAGKVAVSVTAARDAGTPKEDVEKLVVGMVTDSNQQALFRAIVGLTYAMEGVEAPLMQEVTLQMCQKRTGLK
jgi:hypothetical protein